MRQLVAIALAAALGFAGFKFAGGYLACGRFQQAVEQIALESLKMTDSDLTAEIHKAAAVNHVAVEDGGLLINRAPENDVVVVTVRFIHPVDLSVTVVPLRRSITVQRDLSQTKRTLDGVEKKVGGAAIERVAPVVDNPLVE